jgi:hypothetical protein
MAAGALAMLPKIPSKAAAKRLRTKTDNFEDGKAGVEWVMSENGKRTARSCGETGARGFAGVQVQDYKRV